MTWPEFREPKDIDFFADQPVHWSNSNHKVETFWHPRIEDNLDTLKRYSRRMHGNGAMDQETYLANGDFLYTLKVSHAFWALRNGSWGKHMGDIHWMQKKTDAKFIPEIYEIFYPIWEEKHGKKRANLNVSAEDFFTKTVDRTYDHDSIHESVAYHDRPLFNEILKNGSDVAVSKAKFAALPFEKKLQLVREECYATALERQVIPSDYKINPRAAYSWALMKTITSFSKGWFPLFIVLNYSELYKPDVNYIQRHLANKDKLILL